METELPHPHETTSSRGARAAVQEVLATVDPSQLEQFASDLTGIVATLTSSAGLRHAITNPALGRSAKDALFSRLFGDKVGAPARTALSVAGAQRWSRAADLIDVFADLSVEALLATADAGDALTDVEDELFRFGRILAREPQLTLALADPALSPAAKDDLLTALLAGKVSPITLTLVRRVIATPRGLPPERAISAVAELASRRRSELLAVVTSAVPLTDAEIDRVVASLSRLYGRAVHVEVDVDPSLLGGLSVRVGDEVVDGSVRHHLAEARARLTR